MSGESYHQRETPHVPGRVPLVKQHTPSGVIYVPAHSELQEPQQIRAETYRTTERRFVRPDGVEGLETTHEHDVRYAPASRRRQPPGEVGKVMTAVALFFLMCITWDLGGAVAAHLPLYWIGTMAVYYWLTR